MSSIFSYVKAQLKQKFVSNPIKALLSTTSPLVFFIISFIAGKTMKFEKESDIKIVTTPFTLMVAVVYILYIVFVFNGAYDLITEKKKYRKQHMYAHGFDLIKFHTSWTIIYALLILPSSLVIVGITHFANVFPGVNVIIIFLAFYLFQILVVTVSFWLSSYFSNPKYGGLFSTVIQIALTVAFFNTVYFIDDDNFYFSKYGNASGYAPIDQIIFDFKKAVIHNESIGFSNILTKEHIWTLIHILTIAGSILIVLLLAIWSDLFFISRHVKRKSSDRKNQDQYRDIIERSPYTKVKRVSRNEFNNDEGFFDWSEMRQLFKVKKDKVGVIYEEENENVQQFSFKNGKEIINAKNLFKLYDTSNELAISNVYLKIYSNEVTIITGAPDAGKSTLMKMLYGRESSSFGKIIINGREMGSSKWKYINEDISVAPKEDYVFMEHLSVADNIKLYTSMCSTQENGISILNELNFNGNSSDLIKNLDSAERTKLKIALALLKSTNCIFIEEPTALLNEKDNVCFWNVINSRKNKKAIIISTSSMYEALTHGDRIVVLKNGMTQCIGSRDFIKNRLSVDENKPELDVKVY